MKKNSRSIGVGWDEGMGKNIMVYAEGLEEKDEIIILLLLEEVQ